MSDTVRNRQDVYEPPKLWEDRADRYEPPKRREGRPEMFRKERRASDEEEGRSRNTDIPLFE